MRHDHILLRVENLGEMVDFFTLILRLKKGARPAFLFPGVWLYHEHQALIHLVLNETALDHSEKTAQDQYLKKRDGASQQGIVDHIAFQGDDYNSLISRLQTHSIAYFERNVPVSGEHQVFITGPEGLVFEILFNQDKSAITITF